MVRTEMSDNGDGDVIGTVGEGMRTAALNWVRVVGCNGKVCAVLSSVVVVANKQRVRTFGWTE